MEKLELMQQIKEKQADVSSLAEQIKLDPNLLRLYLAEDTYPMPKRIIDKLTQAMAA